MIPSLWQNRFSGRQYLTKRRLRRQGEEAGPGKCEVRPSAPDLSTRIRRQRPLRPCPILKSLLAYCIENAALKRFVPMET